MQHERIAVHYNSEGYAGGAGRVCRQRKRVSWDEIFPEKRSSPRKILMRSDDGDRGSFARNRSLHLEKTESARKRTREVSSTAIRRGESA